MPAARTPAISDDRTFLAFLPVLCAVWADGLMEDAELSAVSRALDKAGWMTAEGRSRVLDWLDPALPPSPAVYGAALEKLRDGKGDSRTLAMAGVSMAGRVASWRADALATLVQLELALGVAGAEALRELTRVEGMAVPAVRGAPARSRAAKEVAAILQGDYPEVRARVRAVLGRPEMRMPDEMPRAEYRERTLAAVRVLAEEGLGAISYPREFGGEGEPAAAVAAFEELALGDLSVLVKYGVQFGLFGGSIAQLGTEKHHHRHLHRIATLALPGCYAMTETGHGSNVRDLRTTADHDPETGGFVITTPDDDARKDYIGNAALHGRMATVFARLRAGTRDHGVHAFLVRLRDEHGNIAPGIRIEDCGPKQGLNGVDNGRIWFEDVRVGPDALLDRFARITPDGEYESPIPSAGRRFFTMLGTLVAGRISIAAASHTVAKKALAIALRYAAGRRQFGPAGGTEVPILDYLALQRELLPRLATSFATTFALRDLVRRFADPDTDRRELEVRAAALKAVTSRHALRTLQACREACGGLGYLAESRFARMKADTDVFTTFEGANPVLLQLVAKGRLSRFRRDMGDLSMWGMARYLAELAGTRLADMNPVVKRRTDPDHLADFDFQLSALRYREQRLMRSAARRLKHRLDEGMDSFEAVNACQDHLITFARAYADCALLSTSVAALREMHDLAGKSLISEVIALFGLATLEAHRAWYLETGYFEPPKSEALRREVNKLCRKLARRGLELVDALGIPEELL
ncbi:MAG: acyl-CoA dehydrogenase family protein [Gemmatimonadetes bacterium]|nr:acyl-CoA dehydrogenase family protein [Gemmatimonadota bacterium]